MLQCRFAHEQELEVNITSCIEEHNQHHLAPSSANKKARNVEKQVLNPSSSNALAHTALSTEHPTVFDHKNNIPLIEQPLYSSDLASCNFFCFQN